MEQDSFPSAIHKTIRKKPIVPMHNQEESEDDNRNQSTLSMQGSYYTPYGNLPFADETILEGMPSRNLKAARLLLHLIKRNKDLAWNKKGEMIAEGERH